MCVLDAGYVTDPILDKLFLNLVAKIFEFKILSQGSFFLHAFEESANCALLSSF